MRRKLIFAFIVSITGLFIMGALPGVVMGDGDETLGAPSIPIATGTGVIAAGSGMKYQPGTVNVDVPPGAAVKQVLLYWTGRDNAQLVDTTDTLIINSSIPIVGDLIGVSDLTGITLYGGLDNQGSVSYRADITNLDLISSGPNSFTVEGMDFFRRNDGVGVIVIIDDGTTLSDIDIRDGNDFVSWDLRPENGKWFTYPFGAAVPQTFTIADASFNRTAKLQLFLGDATQDRRDELSIIVNGVETKLFDVAIAGDGSQWDTLSLDIDIPAGETVLTVEVISPDPEGDNPDSLSWSAAALTVPFEQEPGTGRFTGGGHQIRVDGVRVTRGLTIHCDLLLSNNLEVNWQGNQFHMTDHLETIECSDSPDIDQFPPNAPLDTLIGVGTGRYNGQDGFTIEFTLVDAGEPGRDDMAALLIYETANPSNVVLNVPLQLLDGGNLQAHYDQPHKK